MQACVFVTGVSTIQHRVRGNRQLHAIQQASKAKLQSQFFICSHHTEILVVKTS